MKDLYIWLNDHSIWCEVNFRSLIHVQGQGQIYLKPVFNKWVITVNPEFSLHGLMLMIIFGTMAAYYMKITEDCW